MDFKFFADILTVFFALLIALTFHEAAHAYVAFWQGDSTAKSEGRLTFNPIPHIDPLGTIIIPLMAFLLRFPFVFGWAKPVPVNIYNLKNSNWSYFLVAFAGPLSNFILSIILLLFLTLYSKYLTDFIVEGSILYPIIILLTQTMWISMILCFFNLIPLSPLDGSTVFKQIMPPSMKEFFEDYIDPYGSFILIFLFFSGGLRWIFMLAHTTVSIFQYLFSFMLI